jgi:type I restriction enzyme, S subunit
LTTVLDEFEIPAGWTEWPFRAVAEKVSESGFPELEPLSVFLDAGVVPRSSREDNHNQLGESLEKYQRVTPNDLVFNKLRTWQGGFGISNYEGIVSPAYIIARPDRSIIEPRFLGYLLKSKPYLSELTRLSKWMPPTQFDISWESIRDLKLRIPSLDEQRRIADFLDAQIGTASTLIGMRNLQIASVNEAARSRLSEIFLNSYGEKVSLKRLIKNERLGIWGEDAGEAPLEVVVARVADFNRRNFTLGEVKTVRSIEVRQFTSRKVIPGDILLERSGGGEKSPVGCAVQVRDYLPNLVCSNFVSRIRVVEGVNPEYLSLVFAALYSNGLQAPHSSQTTGIQNLDTESYFQVQIPKRSMSDQLKCIVLGNEVIQGTTEIISGLEKFKILTEEFKTALITAAVTGSIAVNLKGHNS